MGLAMKHIYQKIKEDPRFKQLETKRRRFTWTMVGVLLANELWYIFATAFYPEHGYARFWGTPIGEGYATTWGVVIGFLQTVLFIGLVGLYIYRANNEFDDLKDAIVADAHISAGDKP
jgi:uncharacterized membrane protein (DUF485 family)